MDFGDQWTDLSTDVIFRLNPLNLTKVKLIFFIFF